MLERVPPSAECAAHVFLRHFETPIRSRRILGPQFWRSNGDNLDVPAWWPVYLDTVRSKLYTQSAHSAKSNRRHGTIRSGHSRTVRLSKDVKRAFTRSSPSYEASISPLEAAWGEEEEYKNNETHVAGSELEEPEVQKASDNRRPLRQHLFLSIDGGDVDPKTAWIRFIQSGQSERLASPLLRLLAKSSERNDLKRAIDVYALIPQSQRTLEDFRASVNAATRLNRHEIAIKTIKEALSRKKGQDLFFKFLAYCLQNTLWNTMGNLWKEVNQSGLKTLQSAAHSGIVKSRSPNFAGRFMSCFDIVDDMPSKIVRLADRLHDSDPILAAYKTSLIDICKRMVYMAVENEKMMITIDDQLLSALFSIQQKLGFKSNLHFAALGTINRMSERGAKSKLAKFIYSDFKSHYPEAVVPRWVFGAMIGICAAGKDYPEMYLSILEDYKVAHGTPDDLTYSQVIRACADQGEAAHTQAVFDEFCQHSQPKSVDDINPLIRAHAVTGDSSSAQARFDNVKAEFGFAPNNKSWNALLLAYARSSDPNRAFAHFEAMQKSLVQPDQHSWSIMVSIASRKGDTSHARELLKSAEKAGFAPSMHMTGAIVDSCLLNDNPSEAEKLVTDATQRATEQSPIRLWNSLFRYYAFKADSDAILRTQQNLKRSDVDPDGMTYAALMTALVVQKRTQEAGQILRTLHFNRSLNVTDFHYSILIHGFAREGKQNAAILAYHEMLERFPRSTVSARLAMLHVLAAQDETKSSALNSHSDVIRKPNFEHTFDFFAETLRLTKPTDLASTTPNPGFGRKSARTETESVFLSSLVSFLQRNDSSDFAQGILDASASSNSPLVKGAPISDPSWSTRLQNLSLTLSLAVDNEDWQKVHRFWNQMLDLTLATCSDIEYENDSLASNQTDSNRDKEKVASVMESSFRDMIPGSRVKNRITDKKVLPAHRFILSRPISQYFQALDKQLQHDFVPPTVEKLQQYGFELSSKNWNTVIQVLCRSHSTIHHVLAFEIFEKRMLPNAPTWDVIRRGMWIAPSEEVLVRDEENEKDNRKRRDMFEKAKPGLCMPSYFTMIHLATTLLQYARSAEVEDHAIKLRLQNFSGTFKLVQATPYLRDRVQGVLLRNRKVIGDSHKRRRWPKLHDDLAKVDGTRSFFNHVPPTLLKGIERIVAPQNDIRSLLLGISPRASRRSFLRDTAEDTKGAPDPGDGSTFLKSLDEPEIGAEPKGKGEATAEKRFGLLQQVPADVRPVVPPANKVARSNSNEEQDQVLEKIRASIIKAKGEVAYQKSAPRATLRRGPLHTKVLTKRRRRQLNPGASDEEIKQVLSEKARRSFSFNKAFRRTRAIERAQEHKFERQPPRL